MASCISDPALAYFACSGDVTRETWTDAWGLTDIGGHRRRAQISSVEIRSWRWHSHFWQPNGDTWL